MITRKFTLIEMLVVIAIIGILASMLMPSMQSALESSRGVLCSSQLHQTGMAMQSYAAQNKEFFPYVYKINGAQQVSWDDLLYGYDGRDGLSGTNLTNQILPASSESIYHCPSDDRSLSFARRSYSMNHGRLSGYGSSPADAPTDIWGIAYKDWSARMSSIRSPSQLIAIAENFRSNNWLGNGSCAGMSAPKDYYTYNMISHNENVNFLFVDGHTQAIPPIATVSDNGTLNRAGGIWARQ